MITKAFLNAAMRRYDADRSLFRIGFFDYALDYLTPVTRLYYKLRTFIQNDLAGLQPGEPLNDAQIDDLRWILERNKPEPNSLNDAICCLYETINDQLPEIIEPVHPHANILMFVLGAIREIHPPFLIMLMPNHQPMPPLETDSSHTVAPAA